MQEQSDFQSQPLTGNMTPPQCSHWKRGGTLGSPGSRTSKKSTTPLGISSAQPQWVQR